MTELVKRIKRNARASIQNGNIYLLISFLAVTIFNCIMLYYHDTSRNEAQALLLARGGTFSSIIKELSSEGQTLLYYLLLKFLTWADAGCGLGEMNFIACFVAFGISVFSSAAYLILAPFPKYIRAITVFSPAFVFYPVYANSYHLVVFLFLLCMIAFKHRPKKPYAMAICLAVFTHSHLMVIPLCIGMLVIWVADLYRTRTNVKSNVTAMLLPLASLILAFCFLSDASGTMTMPFLSVILGYMTTYYGSVIAAIFAFLLLLIFIVINKNKMSKFSYLYILTGVLILITQILLQAYFFNTQAELIFITCVTYIFIMWNIFTDNKLEITDSSLSVISGAAATIFILLGILGTYPYIRENIELDESSAKYVVSYITENLSTDDIIYISSDSMCSTVVASCDDYIFISPFTNEEASFAELNANIQYSVTADELKQLCKDKFGGSGYFYLIYCTSDDGNYFTQLGSDFERVCMTPDLSSSGENYMIFKIAY